MEDLGQAIPTIPLDIISPYLTSNRIIGVHEYTSAPYIVGINEGLLSAGADNKVYVMGMDKNTPPAAVMLYICLLYTSPSPRDY